MSHEQLIAFLGQIIIYQLLSSLQTFALFSQEVMNANAYILLSLNLCVILRRYFSCIYRQYSKYWNRVLFLWTMTGYEFCDEDAIGLNTSYHIFKSYCLRGYASEKDVGQPSSAK